MEYNLLNHLKNSYNSAHGKFIKNSLKYIQYNGKPNVIYSRQPMGVLAPIKYS